MPIDGDIMSNYIEGCKFINKKLIAELLLPYATGPAKYVAWLDDLIERTAACSMEPSMVETFAFP